MPRISLLVGDEDLAIIDAASRPNRTAFMVAAAKEVALRVQRARDDDEVARICRENADEDRKLAAEFDCTLSDGL
jgi:hypothetical protein